MLWNIGLFTKNIFNPLWNAIMSLLRPVLGWFTERLYGPSNGSQQEARSLVRDQQDTAQSLPGQFPAQEALDLGSVRKAQTVPFTYSELQFIASFLQIIILELESQQARLSPIRSRFGGSLYTALGQNEESTRERWTSVGPQMQDMAYSTQTFLGRLIRQQSSLNRNSDATVDWTGTDESTDNIAVAQKGMAFLSFLILDRPMYQPRDQRLRGQVLPVHEIQKFIQVASACLKGLAQSSYRTAPRPQDAIALHEEQAVFAGRPTPNVSGAKLNSSLGSILPAATPKKRKRIHLTVPRSSRRREPGRSLSQRPSTAHTPPTRILPPADDALNEATIARLIEFFASEKPHLQHQDSGRVPLGLITPAASDQEDEDTEFSFLDAADSAILGLSSSGAHAGKRKSDEYPDKKDWKRLRIRNGWYASAFRVDTDRKENEDPVIKPRLFQRKPITSSAWIVDDELPYPQLKISSSKEQEIRLKLQHRHEKEEAARIEKLKREEEERRRREEYERKKLEEERRLRTGLRQPARQVIAPMDQTWQSRVGATLDGPPGTGVVKSPEGTMLTISDFYKVVPAKEWLNDEIVNSTLIYLVKYINEKAGAKRCHAFNSFFWKQLTAKGAAGTVRWMKRAGVTKDNFLSFDTILIPICSGLHWTLVVVQPQQRKIAHMDSMGQQGAGRKNVTDVVHQWVREYLQEKYTADWEVVNFKSPVQINGNDCGVHTITNAMFLSLGLDPSFYRAEEMPLQRRRLAAVLLNGGFSGYFDLAGL